MKIIYPDTPKKNENENTFNKSNKRQFGKYSGLKSSPQGNTNKSKESIDNSNTHTLQSGSNISNGHSFTFSDVVLKKTQPVTPRLEKARQLISEFKLNEDSFEQIMEGKEDDNNDEFELIDPEEDRQKRRLYTTKIVKQEEPEKEIDLSIQQENLAVYTQLTPQIEPIVAPNFVDEVEQEGVNIIYEMNEETKKKEINFLSINLFLQKIALQKFCDTNKILITGFIEQYSSFLSLDILIQKIINAFNYYWETKKINIVDLFLFLNQIVIKDLDNIKATKELYSTLKNFYEKIESISWIKEKDYEIKKMVELFQDNIDKFDEDFVKNSLKERKKSNIISVRFKNASLKIKSTFFDIFAWKEEEVAKQLTYISYNLLSKIEDQEIISAKFGKKNKEKTSKNVLTLIERFDELIFFIIEDILSYDRKRKRAEAIEKWIKVAIKCKEFHNYNDCMIITTSFCNYLIKNLKLTWLRVNQVSKKQLESLKKFCNCQQNYINMKLEINDCINNNRPYIPYLGLLLKEITSYEEKMQYIKDNTLINFKKIEIVANCLRRFFQFKRYIYNMRPQEGLEILKCLAPKTEDELENIPAQLEPKFTLTKRKSKTKRLTKTDSVFYGVKSLSQSQTVNSLKHYKTVK